MVKSWKKPLSSNMAHYVYDGKSRHHQISTTIIKQKSRQKQ